jgi:hypothetical protein
MVLADSQVAEELASQDEVIVPTLSLKSVGALIPKQAFAQPSLVNLTACFNLDEVSDKTLLELYTQLLSA